MIPTPVMDVIDGPVTSDIVTRTVAALAAQPRTAPATPPRATVTAV